MVYSTTNARIVGEIIRAIVIFFFYTRLQILWPIAKLLSGLRKSFFSMTDVSHLTHSLDHPRYYTNERTVRFKEEWIFIDVARFWSHNNKKWQFSVPFLLLLYIIRATYTRADCPLNSFSSSQSNSIKHRLLLFQSEWFCLPLPNVTRWRQAIPRASFFICHCFLPVLPYTVKCSVCV